MDTLSAAAKALANQGKELKVFDWDKAAQIIKDRQPQKASAGLSGDWEWTGGDIYKNSSPIPEDDTYVYLASNWATPELEIDGELMDCYIMEGEAPKSWPSENYAKLYWPKSALEILNGA